MTVVPGATALRATTRTAAVIGHPVAHSLSPVIHNAAFAACGVDWAYLAFDVAPGGGAAAVAAMRTLHLGGLSVTMPHKGEVAEAVDRCTPAARRLGAVNCVAWEQGELVGHNTDGDGFVDSLVPIADPAAVGAAMPRPRRRRGGPLGHRGAGRRRRRRGRGQQPHPPTSRDRGGARRIGAHRGVAERGARLRRRRATPRRWGWPAPPAHGMTPLDIGLLHEDQIVVDLVYNPLRTPLLAGAEAQGARTLDGVGMLVHQAARQFTLWTGLDAPIEAMEAAARAGVAERA